MITPSVQGAGLFAAIVLAAAAAAAERSDVLMVQGVATTLAVREGPSLGRAVIGALTTGSVLENVGCRQDEGREWCEVHEPESGVRGWVAAAYLVDITSSAARAGMGKFDATGEIPCAQARDQPMRACPFGVAREGGGAATVVVTRPDGRPRALVFENGAFLDAEGSQADDHAGFGATQAGDLHTVRVGEERYEIPEAVIFGG